MRHPSGILPVIGTGRVERVRSAVGAMKVEYTREEWFEVWEASRWVGKWRDDSKMSEPRIFTD
jgi:predicted oxidoreductase